MRKWGRLLSGVLCLTMLSACALPWHGGAADEPDEGNATAYTVPKDVTVTYPSRSGTGDGQQTSGVPACGGFAVSSSSNEATETGMQILARGGNAVDAAIAMSYVLGVCEPYSSGLGGSGFMVVYMPDEQCAYSLNYRATAGSSYPSDKILVPGLVMGMEEACRQWGTRSMAELMDPAIDYANNGFSGNRGLCQARTALCQRFLGPGVLRGKGGGYGGADAAGQHTGDHSESGGSGLLYRADCPGHCIGLHPFHSGYCGLSGVCDPGPFGELWGLYPVCLRCSQLRHYGAPDDEAGGNVSDAKPL